MSKEDKTAVPPTTETSVYLNTPIDRIYNFLGEEGVAGRATIINTEDGEIIIHRGHYATSSGEIVSRYAGVHLEKFNHRRLGWREVKVAVCQVEEKGITYLETMGDSSDERHRIKLRDILPWPNEETLERVQQALASSLADFLESQASSKKGKKT